jgi:hypothetical protein
MDIEAIEVALCSKAKDVFVVRFRVNFPIYIEFVMSNEF